MSINLAPQQIAAFDAIMTWFKDPARQTFALAGYAGTGKSTLANMIAAECGKTAFLAYTGKAAHVLRTKGCQNVSTIHAALYQIIGADAEGQPIFDVNPENAIEMMDLVIVDEYSMLPENLIKDLYATGAKILYLGDPFQLPPVNGECDIEPDFFLSEIHRQALESPILRYATAVRLGDSFGFCDEGAFKYMPYTKTNRDLYMNAEQVICGRNATRSNWNARFRKFKGLEGPLPVTGDKMICLKNNKRMGLFNGMIGEITSISVKDAFKYNLSFLPEGATESIPCVASRLQFNSEKGPGEDAWYGTQYFDFARAITAHKSQGSEWDNVCVMEQQNRKWSMPRWRYTAATRAAKRLAYIA